MHNPKNRAVTEAMLKGVPMRRAVSEHVGKMNEDVDLEALNARLEKLNFSTTGWATSTDSSKERMDFTFDTSKVDWHFTDGSPLGEHAFSLEDLDEASRDEASALADRAHVIIANFLDAEAIDADIQTTAQWPDFAIIVSRAGDSEEPQESQETFEEEPEEPEEEAPPANPGETEGDEF